MSGHTVTAEWTDWHIPRLAFRCEAPAESLCHAVYGADCVCETWSEAGIEAGHPFHVVTEWDDEAKTTVEVRHVGQFDPKTCNLRDWFENADECLRGSITFPVNGSWEGDFYQFEVTP